MRWLKLLGVIVVTYFILPNEGWATPVDDVRTFSLQAIEICQGPVAKILAAFVLLAGIASLLRGRYKIAVSCGIGFIFLLFLPILIAMVGGTH